MNYKDAVLAMVKRRIERDRDPEHRQKAVEAISRSLDTAYYRPDSNRDDLTPPEEAI
jgi:hypothetical protein